MFDLSLDVTPTPDQLRRWIESFEQDVLNDLFPYWHQVAMPAVKEEIARIFATEGYGSWPPLSPAYARRKAKHYPGKRMLRRKDTYFRAATKRAAGNIFEANADQMIWGIDLGYFASRFGFPYPIAHEKGGPNLPQRAIFELLSVNEHLQNRLVTGLHKYLQKRIRQESQRVFG